jgi:hypothetical protein
VSGNRWLMSALPLKADVHPRSCYVAFVPIATERSAAKSPAYHLVGAAERRKWDYRYIPDLDRIQDAAAEPAKKEE